MSKLLFLFFSIPAVLYLSLVISETYFNKSKKSFYGMFYSVLGILTVTIGMGFSFTLQTFAMNIALVKRIAMVPLLLLMGSGLVFGTMCVIRPLEHAKFFMQHKKLFLIILGIFIFLAILDNFL